MSQNNYKYNPNMNNANNRNVMNQQYTSPSFSQMPYHNHSNYTTTHFNNGHSNMLNQNYSNDNNVMKPYYYAQYPNQQESQESYEDGHYYYYYDENDGYYYCYDDTNGSYSYFDGNCNWIYCGDDNDCNYDDDNDNDDEDDEDDVNTNYNNNLKDTKELQHSGHYLYELGPIDIPFDVSNIKKPSPLEKKDFDNNENQCKINSKSPIWVCEDDHWALFHFECIYDGNVGLVDTKKELHIFDLNDLPLMYLQPTENTTNENEKKCEKNEIGNNIDHMIKNGDENDIKKNKKSLDHEKYKKGAKLQMDIPTIGFTLCEIVEYDAENTKCELKLGDNRVFKLYLDAFDHSFVAEKNNNPSDHQNKAKELKKPETLKTNTTNHVECKVSNHVEGSKENHLCELQSVDGKLNEKSSDLTQ